MWTFKKMFAAHLGGTGRLVTIPDQVCDDQKRHDNLGTVFPAKDSQGNEIMVRLDGEAYGLNTPGTGDCVVREVAG